MAVLHELLAVEGNLKAQSDKTRTELIDTFNKKRHLFTESVKTFQPLEEDKPAVTEEQSFLQSTIAKELAWVEPFLSKAIDAQQAIEEANTQARGDVILDNGTVLFKGLPATLLLSLEKRVKEIQDLVAAIPTLDPAKGFKPDADRGEGIYKASEDLRPRTKKEVKPIVLYPATDKHPAQVQAITEDVPIGTIKLQEWSGLITPAQKADMLARVEDLLRAIKKARSRANEVKIEEQNGNRIGAKLVKYALGIE